MSSDDYARAIIAEGQRRGITVRGIVIALATGLVESNIQVYANPRVPESMNIPHDAVASDSYSVGIFQQQVRDTGNGWWWGDAQTCMDPTLSAGLFYGRLANLDYNGPNSPGSYAQDVQDSAYPDRYDERMGEAQQLYDRLASGLNLPPVVNAPAFTEINVIGERAISNQCQDRDGTPIDLLLGHTVEGDLDGEDLIAFMESKGERSYHYIIKLDGSTVWDLVDTDEAAWSVLSANNRSINYVIGASYAGWNRDQWLDKARNAIRVMAYLMVQDAIKYDVEPRVLAPPYDSDPPGISDHHYVTVWLGDGTHTDLGEFFPWDVLTSDVNEFLGEDDMPLVNQPSGSIYRESNDDLPWAGTPMDFIMDAQIHEGRVEQLAKDGVPKAVALVQAVADGSSPVSDSLSDDAKAQAQAILDVIATPKTARKAKVAK